MNEYCEIGFKQKESIIFDSNFKTFQLYPGNSLYAFSISPELSLEHIYWGKRLPAGYDLRYLSQSSRMSHFNTAEVQNEFQDNVQKELFSNLKWTTIPHLRDTWKSNKNAKVDNHDALQQRRAENLSWRIMSTLSVSTSPVKSLPPAVEILSNPVDFVNLSTGTQPLTLATGDDEDVTPILASSLRPRVSMDDSSCHSAGSSETRLRGLSFGQDSMTSLSPGRVGTPGRQRSGSRTPSHRRTFERLGGQIGKGVINVEYSDHGTGDFRSPSFVVIDTFDGSSISPLRYRRHEIFPGKKPFPDNQPCIRFVGDKDVTTLIITMADLGSGLEVDLVW